MAVAFDAMGPGASGTGTVSWTHTPVGTPRGILVVIWQLTTAADQVTGCTYGGVAMTEVSASPLIKSTGETGVLYTYFLGSSIPTGAQTVQFTVSGAATKGGNSMSVTADTDTELVDVKTIQNDSLANPAVTLVLGGRSALCSIGFMSGHDAVGGIAPLSGWTDRGEGDLGTQTTTLYTYDTVSTVDVSAGYTATAEDVNAIATAIGEVAAAASLRRASTLALMGVGR